MSRRRRSWLAFAFWSLSISWAAAADDVGEKLPWDADPRLPETVTQAMQDRDYDAAIKALDALLENDDDKKYDKLRLQYFRARAHHLAGRYDEAVAGFLWVEAAADAKNAWAHRSRFARGVSLAKKGDFASAETIYRAEAEYLLSHERKQELADVYLSFAKKYATPRDDRSPPDQPPPDFGKAIEFYRQALALGPRPELRADIDLAIAECFRLAGNHGEAAMQYERFLGDYPDDPRTTEARFRRGEGLLNVGAGLEARRVWQDLIALWPGDRNPPSAAQTDYLAQAMFRLAQTYGLPNPGSDDDLALGTAALDAFLKRFPDHRLARRANLWIVQARVHCGHFAEAVAAAQRFLTADDKADKPQVGDDLQPAEDEAAQVRNLLGLALQRQKKFDDAIAAWREFLVRYPAHPAWNEVQQRIVETEFLVGAEAFAKKDREATRRIWTEFLARYPLDPRSPQILLNFGRLEFNAEKYDAAIAEWRRLVSKYPGSEPASQAQLLIGLTFEEKLAKPTVALEEYRKLNWGSRHGEAQSRIAALTSKQLEVVTERIFRTDETPKLLLKSRNVESVNVRVYTIDLETYFRKMHLARGVEWLDLALIDPDASFEYKLPDYAEYRPMESRVEVPLPDVAVAAADKSDAKPQAKNDDKKKGQSKNDKAGVVAVVVSSKTLEATTLLIRSDLDVVVKSSRDEVFVFAENMRTGKPWEGARLLVSDGSEVVAEGTTGADGVFRSTAKQLKQSNDVRVFAVASGNTASNVVNLQNVGVGRGLEERGYVYTDRSTYRPGQAVHVRAILRGVSADRFVVPPAKKYRVEVYDPRSRVIYTAEASSGDFGSLHTFFALPESAVPGDYRVQACAIDGKCYAGSFRVENYQPDAVQFTIDVPRKTFYRGEEIEGVIRAKFYYGTPLAGRDVRYTFSDGRTETAKTDEAGEVKFKLPTREFRESQTLQLVAELPERNLRTATQFFLAVQGFSIDVSTVRDVVTAGESFEVSLTTKTADGKPTGETLKLTIVEKTTVDGRPGENVVATRDVTTDEKTGIGRTTLQLEKGATYLLRVEGRDRFDNPVVAGRQVFVSDDSDRVRLRILADRHTYQLGEEARIRVHWREEPALALVTFQGARILDYRLVQLKTGDNLLDVPMDMKLAPNFQLEVNVMLDVRDERTNDDPRAKPQATDRPIRRRFHSAASPFVVERALAVKLTPQRRDGKTGDPQPGETIDVAVETLDPQGRPVAAEVGLALVDKANFDRFGNRVEAIDAAFRGVTREAAMRTVATIDFAYQPTTHAINARLLSEAERLEIAKNEAASRALVFTANISAPTPVRGDFAAAATDPFGGRLADGEGNKDADGVLRKELEQLAELPVAPQSAPEPTAGYAPPASKPQSELKRGAYPNDVADRRHAEEALGRESNIQNFAFAIDESRRFSGGAEEKGESQPGFDDRLGIVPLPSERQLDRLGRYGESDLIVITDGVQANLGYFEYTEGTPRANRYRELLERGAVMVRMADLQETAYWNPSIVTDAKGRATVAVTLPERSAAWKLSAKGITQDTLAGEGDGELVAKKVLFAELRTPAVLTDGDSASIEVNVHDTRAGDDKPAAPIKVTLRTTVGAKSTEEVQQLEKSAALHELAFPISVTLPTGDDREAGETADEFVELTLTVQTGDRKDVVRRVVPIRPYGYPLFAAAGGTATSDTTVWLEPPAGLTFERPRLEVVVGASIERDLLNVVLGGSTWCDYGRVYASPLETTTSDLMASLALQKLLGATREQAGPEVAELDGRVRSTLGSLASSQSDDGGWSWTGRGGASNRYATARVVWALSLARRQAYTVTDDVYAKATSYLQSQLTAVADDDLEGKSVVLHALAEAGQGDFAIANRLYRGRSTMSAAAAAYLGLALVKMDHAPMAADLLNAVLARETNLKSPAKPLGELACNAAPAEVRALLGLALSAAKVASPRRAELVELVQADRSGNRWTPDKATGPAVMLLAEWFAEHKPGGERYELIVVVNDYETAKLEVDPNAAPVTIAVDPRHLKDGKQHVQFKMTGRGHLAYRCTLGGFVPAGKVKSTMPTWTVRRNYQPAPREIDGRELSRGFGVVEGNYRSFDNPLTQLPIGRRGRIELSYWLPYDSAQRNHDKTEYLILREPLPAGTAVVEGSVSGSFERFELLPAEIVFYVGNQRSASLRYDVVGSTAGEYRAAQTMLVDAHRPERMAVAAVAELAVLPRGKRSVDKYRWSPDELFALGKHAFGKRDWQAVQGYLGELLSDWNLRSEPYLESLKMLLDAHLELGPPREVVRYFELVKEKSPELEIPFEKILKVGTAYHELGEYERSYLVFRATIESSFARDGAVAGFLESQGEFVRSVAVMRRLLGEYPPEPYVAAAEYALAQNTFAYAPNAAADPRMRAAKITRIDLIHGAERMLDDFLTAYPDDPAADEAAFAQANTLLDLEFYDRAVARCEAFAKRYPKSEFYDSYLYVIGFCHFAAGRHEEALEICRKVAEMKRTDPTTGREVEARNRQRALYILGQVYHSLGQAAEAIAEYKRVADQIPDAKQAIDYFTHREISLPEVTTIRPGEPAVVTLKHRNVASCDVKAYRIDLMKFSLLRQNLSELTKINLAGIRPLHETTIDLGDGKDYRDRERELKLPIDEVGAYFVVCRGDNLHAGGFVLVTPLKVEVQEDATVGSVRATVKDVVADKFVPEVHVKVIGSRDGDFKAGETDLRGVFAAEPVAGKSTVIAQLDDDRYAFFRGTTDLLPQTAPNAPASQPADMQQRGGSMPQGESSSGKSYLLEQLRSDNDGNTRARQQELRDNYYNNPNQNGVKAKAAF